MPANKTEQSPPDPDAAFVERARSGDFDAFDQLVDRYEGRVYTLALRILQQHQDAEEVVQDTFLSVLEHLRDFKGQSTLHTWLVRIATNHALKLLARRKTRKMLSIEPFGEGEAPLPRPQIIAEWTESPEKLAQRHEIQDLVMRALEDIDEKYRLIFLLRDVERMSTEEAADLLDISVANAKVRLLRARLLLRERLTEALGDPDRRLTPHHDH